MEFKEKKQAIYKIIMLVILTSFITFVITTLVMYNRFENVKLNPNLVSDTNSNGSIESKLSELKQKLNQKYLGEIDLQKLQDGAAKGYVAALEDPYTQYFTKEEWEDFKIDALGNYYGVGIYLTNNIEDNTITIVSPVKGTPAEAAGILPGDIILKVDDVSYTGEQLNEASSKIKGPDGTKVKLQIKRKDEILDFEIERKHIKLNHVEGEVLSNNIGYIQIASFDEGCAEEFEEKYNELKNKNIKSLIIDLRNNPGGLLQESLDIADFIVPKGKDVLITVDKSGKKEIDKSKKDPIITIPIVVLVNENSASASEILCGALKDNGCATVIGTKTYGKGVIQQVFPMEDGSAIKITIEEYYTPANNKINKVGITPDIEIDLPDDLKNTLSIPRDKDVQLNKAIQELK